MSDSSRSTQFGLNSWTIASEISASAESQLDIMLTRADFVMLFDKSNLFRTIVDLKQKRHIPIRLLCPYTEYNKHVIRQLVPFLSYRSFTTSLSPGLSIFVRDGKDVYVIDEIRSGSSDSTENQEADSHNFSNSSKWLNPLVPSQRIALAKLLTHTFESLWLQSESYEALRLEKIHSDHLIDLISHDIGNHHQIMKMSLDLQEMLLRDLHIEENQRAHENSPAGLDSIRDTREQLAKLTSEFQGALQRSMNLVANVRKLGKLYHEKSLQLEKISLIDAIEKAETVVQASVPKSGSDKETTGKTLRIIVEHPALGSDSIEVLADDLCSEIFANLFSNSSKHGERSSVEIAVGIGSLELGGVNYWLVNVADNGKGISDEAKKMLFNRFAPKSRGAGLGLFIVKELVNRYGGKIWVEDKVSGDPSKGASFGIMLRAV
ncbi:MAG: sensor histidine kinase [Nitrososphaerales archaeon]